jgi:GTP cyclohydrolase III
MATVHALDPSRTSKGTKLSAKLAHGRWYAIVSGHHVSHLIRVRGGTLVGLGTTPADALRDCGDLLEAIDAAQRLDTTDGGW